MITDYQIALIIITIIGFIVTTAFYVYFVYLPAARAEAQLDLINKQGENLVTLVNQKIVDIGGETTASLKSSCEIFLQLICDYNANITTGCPVGIEGPRCILTQEAYPKYCNPIVPFNPDCTCPPIPSS